MIVNVDIFVTIYNMYVSEAQGMDRKVGEWQFLEWTDKWKRQTFGVDRKMGVPYIEVDRKLFDIWN